MNIYGYLRASTKEQDAQRAKAALEKFACDQSFDFVNIKSENVSGSIYDKPVLMELIEDMPKNSVIVVEQIDRITRLKADDWDKLKDKLKNKGIRLVSIDLPTSYKFLQSTDAADETTKLILNSINQMLMDILAVTARKDYEDRRRRQQEGIDKAKAQGKFKGRQTDTEMHKRAVECVITNKMSIRKTAEYLGCAVSTVQRAVKAHREQANAN